MNYIVLDLEWNQPMDGIEANQRPLPFEIVEIGAIKLDENREIIGEFTQIVRPSVYSEMNRYTGDLIQLRMAELKQGKPFQETMTEFLEWCGTNYLFCTWGPLDLVELQRNMRYYDMEPLSDRPFTYYDVQKLFSIAYEDKKLRRSLEFAVEYLHIEQDIPFHRAFSDAYYTAKVFATIQSPMTLENYSYDVFHLPKNKKEEVHVLFHDYLKYISREFEDRNDAIADREVLSTRCYLCEKNLRKKIRWFSVNGKHFYSVAYCEKHGYLKGKIRIRKSENNGVYVVKTQKFIDEDEVAEIAERQNRLREHRRDRRTGTKH